LVEKNETTKILELEDIHTYYGDSHIIQGLSLYVERGEIVCILGRNGVGKTTTLRSIMGLTPPRLGHIRIEGEDTTGWPAHKVARKRVAYVFAERHIFPGLSVDENLKIAERASVRENSWTVERVYKYFPELAGRKKQDGNTLSGGEQQMLAIGRGLMGNPKIVLLDEPSQGLAPVLVDRVVDIVETLCREQELTLLLVEQNFRIALRLASRHYLMSSKGNIERIATTQELLADEEIVKKHLAV